MNAFNAVHDFERALCEYTGAPFAVAVNSCSMALLLAVAWHLPERKRWFPLEGRPAIEIPKRTYLSVPMSIIHAGGRPTFRDDDWLGCYQLKPLPVVDCARWFTAGLWEAVNGIGIATKRVVPPSMLCVSFHHSKTLGDTQGGAILLDNPEADAWLRRARFDGRTEGVAPKDDKPILGWHCYMSPDVATRLTWRLSKLPLHNAPLPNDDYPDLSKLEIFR